MTASARASMPRRAATASTGRDAVAASANTKSCRKATCAASMGVVVKPAAIAAAASSLERSGRAMSARTRGRSDAVATPRRTCSASLDVSDARDGAATARAAATAITNVRRTMASA